MRGNYDFLISKAKGSWLTILGQDDAMMPFAISELRRSLEKIPDMSALVSRRAYAFWLASLEFPGVEMASVTAASNPLTGQH